MDIDEYKGFQRLVDKALKSLLTSSVVDENAVRIVYALAVSLDDCGGAYDTATIGDLVHWHAKAMEKNLPSITQMLDTIRANA